MRRIGGDRFTAVLPFKRSNRNFYNAMAGAALLGNSEVAAGMYLFKQCGSDYAVVCKTMTYKFLRPCHGPAVYNVKDADSVASELTTQMTTRDEFNIEFTMDITQILHKRGKEVRVARTASRERRAGPDNCLLSDPTKDGPDTPAAVEEESPGGGHPW